MRIVQGAVEIAQRRSGPEPICPPQRVAVHCSVIILLRPKLPDELNVGSPLVQVSVSFICIQLHDKYIGVQFLGCPDRCLFLAGAQPQVQPHRFRRIACSDPFLNQIGIARFSDDEGINTRGKRFQKIASVFFRQHHLGEICIGLPDNDLSPGDVGPPRVRDRA